MTSRSLKRGCKLFWWSSITLYDTANESKYTFRPGSVVCVKEAGPRGEPREGYVEIRGTVLW